MFWRFLFSRIWSSAQDHAVLVLLLSLVGFFISTWQNLSGGNDLYWRCTSFEKAFRWGRPLNILHDSWGRAEKWEWVARFGDISKLSWHDVNIIFTLLLFLLWENFRLSWLSTLQSRSVLILEIFLGWVGVIWIFSILFDNLFYF